jgi:prepilin-type N-terminal cleavage/methylation domain-containing protein
MALTAHTTGQRGFTIIESMVAMVIFFVGALGVMGMQLASIRVNRMGGQMTQAMMYADEKAQSLLVLSWDDVRIADVNGGNNPPSAGQAFPWSNPLAAVPDVSESTTTVEGLLTTGQVVPVGTGESFQRYWMISDEDINPSISGVDVKRIRAMVRFRDGESDNWHEVGVTVVKAKVQ